MSGGSFDYLCWKDPHEMLSEANRDRLRDMEDWLRAHGKDDAADELHVYGLDLRTMARRAVVAHERLNRVLYIAEWWASSDIGEDGFDKGWQEWLAKHS